jgi:Uma2 family endonuclease
MEIGIQEYWLIDRFRRIMTVFRPNQPEIILTESETYSTPLLPGFELPLARLFAVADQWDQTK